jgi:hypothetical protein
MGTTFKFIFAFLVPVLLLFQSCAKEEGHCLTNSGPIVKQQRHISDFDTIALYDYVNLILTQDTFNSVSVEAGQNIISGISTEVVNRVLIIRNYNECNWVRSYNKPINAYVSVKNLRSLYYESSGDVTSTNAIISPLLKIDVWGGCGTIELTLNVYEGFFIQHLGTGDIRLHGICSISSVYAGDFGLIQCSDLETGYSFINNSGSNDCYIKASQYLDATINSIGDIYYLGTPDTIRTHFNGTGHIYQIGN